MTNWAEIRDSMIAVEGDVGEPPELGLPALPAAATEFARLADDPDVAVGRLAGVVERDAGLTLEMLKYVNSSRFGLERNIRTVAHAIAGLGIRRTRTFLLSAAVQCATSGRKCRLLNIANFTATNFERAALAREIAALTGADRDEAFLSAMIQDYLLPVVASSCYEKYLNLLKRRDGDLRSVTQLERETFGWDHATAGACILHGWGFPDELVSSVGLHHRGIELLDDPVLGGTPAAAVVVSALIPDQINQTPGGLDILADLTDRWPQFDLPLVAERIDNELRQSDYPFSMHISLLDRCRNTLG